MRKAFMTAIAVIALAASPTFASDMAIGKARAPGAAEMPWTGFYVGGHIGGGWADTSSELNFGPGAIFATNPNPSGFLAGGQFGALYQFRNGWVLGAEVSLSKTWMDDTDAVSGLPAGINLKAKASDQYLGIAQAKLGYGFDNWLLYVSGGAAWKRSDLRLSLANAGSVTSDKYDTNGWTIGAGASYAFAQNWSLDLSYNYIDWNDGNASFKVPGFGGGSIGVPITNDPEHVVKLGVNYKFGS